MKFRVTFFDIDGEEISEETITAEGEIDLVSTLLPRTTDPDDEVHSFIHEPIGEE